MMVPDYFNSPPSPFPSDDREHQFFFPAYDHQASSSSYSMFFPDQAEPCSFQMHQDHQPQQVEDANYQVQYTGSQGLADHEIKPSKGLKITLWKNSEKSGDRQNPVKWMSSKMRMMQKMKNKSAEHDDQDNYRHQNSPRESTTDHFSSSNSSSNNSTAPFRVCSDCNTTKTPLWRSGPKGPKSLCNACGIRQRKARRAMAAAAAAGAASAAADPQTDQAKSKTAAVLKIKVQSKEKVKNNGVQIINTTPFKKRCTRMICGGAASPEEPPPAHAEQKSSVFEDFLINLSNNLAVHRVFPQDEKEAAILLMAISSGLVHG